MSTVASISSTSPANTGCLRRSFETATPGAHADPAGWPRVDGHPQLEAPRDQSALQVDGRPEIRALREQRLPATFGLSKESFGVQDTSISRS